MVVHLGTMIGGHYIAYTLVDPERMFQDARQVVDAMKDLNVNGNGDQVTEGAMPSVGSETSGGKRVWCYCSE